jgi:hypothetical protein
VREREIKINEKVEDVLEKGEVAKLLTNFWTQRRY